MTILFAGNNLQDFIQLAPGTFSSTVTASRFNSSRVRSAVTYNVTAVGSFGGLGVDIPAQASVYTVAQCYGTGSVSLANGATHLFIYVTNTGSRIILRLVSSASATPTVELRTVTVGGVVGGVLASFTMTQNALQKFHFSLENMGASATFNVHINGSLQMTYTGDLTAGSAATSVVRAVLGWTSSQAAGNTTAWSEVVIADEDARDFTLVEAEPLANGATYTGSGSFADIDESQFNDADVALLNNVGEVVSFKPNKTRITAGGNSIRAMVISARMSKAVTGPQTAEFGVTTSAGTAYAAAKALPTALDVVQQILTVNPVSGANWTNADVTNAAFDVNIRAAT